MDTSEIEKLAALEETHWWYRERRAVLARLIRQLGEPGKALDIGAACGGNTRVLRDNGWAATALEFSAAGTDICRARQVAAVRGDALSLPFADASLDLVVAYDVLEHIDDDGAAVREVHRTLRPGGHFLVAVPADPTLWSEHDVAVDHRRRYTVDTLATILADNGFQITDMWNWNVIMRSALKLRRRRSAGSDLDHVNPVLNSLLTGIIRLERYLPLSNLPGVSVFVQAQSMSLAVDAAERAHDDSIMVAC